MERAILVRHAESTYSARDIVNGDPYRYVGLTSKGAEQARRLGELIRDEPISLCITSRFPRTRESADIALNGRPIPRQVLEEFDDVKMGDFEGKPVEEVRAFQRLNGPAVPLPGGGESRVDSIRRYCRAYGIVLARDERVILVVTHGLPVTAVLIALRGEDVPVTLEGIQALPADPHTVSASDLRRAVEHLEDWAARTAS
jgi:2,3-bisphosphoglycerate-dependent phosphoglycerate mutase